MAYKATDIIEALTDMADASQARGMMRFFKTGPGQYGEGDRFLGIRNPLVRAVVKEAWRHTPLHEAVALVSNQWHEVRLCGLLIMVEQYQKAYRDAVNPKSRPDTIRAAEEAVTKIHDTYLSLHPHVNNWDLVDLSAPKIVGCHEHYMRRRGATLMDQWIKPGHTLWQRRIAMVSTWQLTRRGMPEAAYRRAACLLDSREDLLHKAAGWMLRETWKQGYADGLRAFLTDNVGRMPSVMLSYACEQMTPSERLHWRHLRHTVQEHHQ